MDAATTISCSPAPPLACSKMAGTHGNRTHQEPVSRPLTGFEDRAGHQPRTRSRCFVVTLDDLFASGLRALGRAAVRWYTLACRQTIPRHLQLALAALTGMYKQAIA